MAEGEPPAPALSADEGDRALVAWVSALPFGAEVTWYDLGVNPGIPGTSGWVDATLEHPSRPLRPDGGSWVVTIDPGEDFASDDASTHRAPYDAVLIGKQEASGEWSCVVTDAAGNTMTTDLEIDDEDDWHGAERPTSGERRLQIWSPRRVSAALEAWAEHWTGRTDLQFRWVRPTRV